MLPKTENPARGGAGLSQELSFHGDAQTTSLNPAATQEKIALLHEDIFHNVSALQVQLDCAIAMGFAADTTGLLYSLRRAKAYWRYIALSAAELVAADAERLSALRQGEDGQ